MRFLKRVATKKILSLVLMVALCITNVQVTGREKFETEAKASAFDEIQKSDISEEELEEISEMALRDGEKTADKINQYTDDVDYEEAVNYALTAYYKNEAFEELKDFEETIDSRSIKTVEAYKAAAKERKKGDSNGYEAGKVLITFDKDTTEEEIHAVIEAENGQCEEIVKCFNDQYFAVVSISLGQTVKMAVEDYSEYSITENASANYYEELSESAIDYVNDKNASAQYYLDNVNVKEAWDYVSQTQHQKVLVGVIDSGVQIDHPDLKNVISPYSADVTKGDTPVLLSECEVRDTSGHGTWVTGVLAAEANNSQYIAGVASCYSNDVVEILGVQASTYYESYGKYMYALENEIKAVNYCMEKGVKVINISLGNSVYKPSFANLVKDVTEAGVIVVCSAGNTATSENFYSSDYDETISVVATNANNTLCDFTSYGMKKDICAPGNEITTLSSRSGISVTRGTSFASPIVAGVAAMMCSVNSSLNYTDVRRILADTALDIQIGDKCRNGLVNAGAAVKMAAAYDNSQTTSNLSLNKPVTVSSTYSADFPAENMVDGIDNTKWISEATDGQSITIDLEDTYLIENIEIAYDQFIVSGLQVEISTDGIQWKEITNDDVNTLYTSNIFAGITRARYVRMNYTGNTSYVIIKEITVRGYEILTEDPTPGMEPQEVFGQVVSSNANNHINVVWGSNTTMEQAGQTYNVYIDGTKVLSNVVCGSYDFYDIAAGTHTVKITAVYNGSETSGVTATVTVAGETTTTAASDTPPGYTTAGANWTNLNYWSVYFASGWGGDPTGSYKDGGSYSSFGVYVGKYSGSEWGVQLKTQVLSATIGKTYTCKVSATFNSNMTDTITFKDEGTNTAKKYTLVNGTNNFEIDFTPTADNTQIFIDLGKVPAGGNFVITGFSLKEKEEETTKVFDAFSIIEAEQFTSNQGGVIDINSSASGGYNIGGITNGVYMIYENVNFSENAGAIAFCYSSPTGIALGNAEIYVDSFDNKVGTIVFTNNASSWQEYGDITANLDSEISAGSHTVYVKYVTTGDCYYVANIDYFKFIKASGGVTEEPTTEEPTTEETTTEEMTTEEPTTEETTTEEETTKAINTINGGIEVNGYQVSATTKGMRVIYSVDSEVNGKKVVSSGLIYSLADYVDASELYVGSTSYYVRSYESTSAGVSDTLFSDSDIATSYAMTMKFAAGIASEYSAKWRIRAYAKLSDGTYVYTDSYTYTIYDVADVLYQGCMMNSKAQHDYLYTDILSIVNQEYKEKDYDWGNIVVGA